MNTGQYGKWVWFKTAGIWRGGKAQQPVFALGFAMMLMVVRAFGEPDPTCEPGQVEICSGGSSIALVRTSTNTVTVCPGKTLSVTVDTTNILGLITTIATNSDCIVSSSTNAAPSATAGNTWWNATGLVTTSGSGLTASFSVPQTNSGTGTITFYISYCNSGVCTNCATNSISVNYTVVTCKVDVVRNGGSDVINKCLFPTRYAFFCLTGDSCVGDVTWSISPTLPNGATVIGFADGCVSIEIGNVVTNYTITATSNENTNCVGTASLFVGRDCDCTQHIISLNPVNAPGLGPNSPACGGGDSFSYGSFTNTCGSVLSLICNGSVYYTLNGNTVGHCPYLASDWSAKYWPCECGDVIMKTEFKVEHVWPFIVGPGSGKGKIETWTCSGGFDRWCYETRYGIKVDRVGGCTTGDE
jgi:hypothetical protein